MKPSRKSVAAAVWSLRSVARETESRVGHEPREPRFLERDVVIRVQVVRARDLDAVVEQPCGDVHADEAGRARDEHLPKGIPPDRRFAPFPPEGASAAADRTRKFGRTFGCRRALGAARRARGRPGGAHRRDSACSARSFAYLRKLFWQPIAMWTSPATPSRKPSLST